MFESLNSLAYTTLAGKPLIMWGGVTMLILILSTGLTAYLHTKRIGLPTTYKIHRIFGSLTILVGLLHGLLGFSKYLM